MNKKKIVFVIGTLSVGGTQRQMLTLAQKLTEYDYSTLIIVFDAVQDGIDLTDYPDVKIQLLNHNKPKSKVKRFCQWLTLPFRLNKLIRQARPDYIYSMLEASNFFAWLSCPGNLSKRLIWGYRSSTTFPGWQIRFFDKLAAIVSSFVPLMITNSKLGRDYALSIGYKPKSMITIPNGTDIVKFSPREIVKNERFPELSRQDETIVVGIVGRIDPVKRHDLFIKAACESLKINGAFEFVIIGDGPTEKVRALKQLASNLGGADRIHWLGSRDDLPTCYNQMQVLVLCSDSEGFPNVICEAMSCGTPVVATNVGDTAWILGDLGKIVGNEPTAIRDGVLEVLSRGKEERQKVRSRIESTFSLEHLAEETIKAFNLLN